ncbi:MAG TPA: lipoyl synthase [Phycisphaerae bacterium]|nr:lipoyl synthase [Phycisphaerae bacterium]
MLNLPILSPPETSRAQTRRRLPPWLKRPLPAGRTFALTKRTVADSGVATVCQEARCPNLSECWSAKTATFMILGDRCTRRCQYCAVSTARPDPPAEDEPQRLAQAVARLGLRHVVITAVARDDLPDEGAGHFAACVRRIGQTRPQATVEVLPADFHARPDCIAAVCDAAPDIYNHNIETVERLTPIVRPQARYRRSLDVLRIVKLLSPDMLTKSGLMIGLGETEDEITRTFEDLRQVDCDVLTVGQYLQPTPGHTPVARFYHPREFDRLARVADDLGFVSAACGPFVRSSYNAAEVFARSRAAGNHTTPTSGSPERSGLDPREPS